MKKRLLGVLLSTVMTAAMLTGCSSGSSEAPAAPAEAAEEEGTETGSESTGGQKTFYYVAPGLGQPYSIDMIKGLQYAAEKYNVKIIAQGANDWDSDTACAALEQVIPNNPDGIITAAWDAAMNPGILKAQEAGIPIIVVEAESGEFGDLYIGLDNVDAGRETAQELIKAAGNSGKLLVIGNWGSTNIDQKYEGLKEVLADTDWEIVGDQDGECDAAASLQAAKDLLSANPDVDAFVGLDSACGGGIAGAMEELGMEPGSITVICADREDAMLDYIQDGYIHASLTNRTAAMTDMAVALLVNATDYGFLDVPVSSDNEASAISVWPLTIYTGNVVITKDNVENFYHDALGEYGADNYEG